MGLPIRLENADGQKETINEGSALWSRPPSEIDEDQYREFYHHVAHMPGEPWHRIHLRAEGRMEYTALLFVPDTPPFDLFDPARRHRVRLYVKRVFITDECEGLLPPWLRFMRGVVDSSDLALNVSRETLQHDPILAKISGSVVKRILSDLAKRAAKDAEGYAAFWENFGPVLKEGLYEDGERKDPLLALARFQSVNEGAKWLSLDDYVGAMKEDQEAIYYVSGEDRDGLRRSPQVEGFRARGLDVLLMADPVDQFWLPTVGDYKGKPFRSITQGAADLARFAPAQDNGEAVAAETPAGEMDKLVALVKLTLGDDVKDVRTSERLTESPVCLVAEQGDLDMHLERLLRQHQHDLPVQKRVLEVNPSHALIRTLAAMVGQKGASDVLEDAAYLLLDQARILEGEPVPDPAAFTRRITGLVSRSLES